MQTFACTNAYSFSYTRTLYTLHPRTHARTHAHTHTHTHTRTQSLSDIHSICDMHARVQIQVLLRANKRSLTHISFLPT